MRFLIRLYSNGKEMPRAMSEQVGSEAYSGVIAAPPCIDLDSVDSEPGRNANPYPKLGKLVVYEQKRTNWRQFSVFRSS